MTEVALKPAYIGGIFIQTTQVGWNFDVSEVMLVLVAVQGQVVDILPAETVWQGENDSLSGVLPDDRTTKMDKI